MPYAEQNSRDFKRFMIKPLHLQNVNGVSAPSLYFNSIITEFTDTWTPRWNSVNVYGRMDPLPFYGGTSRELAFGFRIVSDSAIEAKKNMAKIQKLVQYQYPLNRYVSDYGPNSTSRSENRRNFIQAPPYFELEFLNLFKSGKGKVLKAYINGPVQVNPGFQTKDQAQYFSLDFSEVYFSDVTVTLRLQVLHDVEVISAVAGPAGASYPYGINQAIAENLNTYAITDSGTTPAPSGQAATAPPAPEPATNPVPQEKTQDQSPTSPAKKQQQASVSKTLTPLQKVSGRKVGLLDSSILSGR